MEAPQRIRYLFGMDTETGAAFAALHTTLREGLGGLREEMTAGLSTLREEMKAGFARTDHFFELQQGQFQDWRKEMLGEFAKLTGRVDRLERTLHG